MKTLLRKRYYCDFCRKSGGLAPSMKNHEEMCFMNPNRICQTCDNQATMKDLLQALAEDKKSQEQVDLVNDVGWPLKAWIEQIPKLIEVSGGCPVCIQSALRQAKVYLPDFDYTAKLQEWQRRKARLR